MLNEPREERTQLILFDLRAKEPKQANEPHFIHVVKDLLAGAIRMSLLAIADRR